MTTVTRNRLDDLLLYIRSCVEARKSIARPIGAVYSCADELILDLGTSHELKPCPTDMVGAPKYCYDNCLTIVLDDDEERFRYVEGYALLHTSPIPVFHAWILDTQDNQIIDPTWTWEASYFGVVMPKEVVCKATLRNSQTGIFESDWTGDYYFVREGWREL